MDKIYIFTDSSSDIPPALVERYQIDIAPIKVTYEGRTLREYYDITPQAYWKILEQTKDIPVTTQATPVQYLEIYQRARLAGCTHVLGVTINAKGSGCYQSACMARDMFYEEFGKDMTIELVDSETYTMVYGRVVLKAAQMREMGAPFDQIVQEVRSALARSEAVLGVYTLQFLKKSGRISGGAAFVGEALGLRPISHVYAGGVNVCGKVRGDKNVTQAMVNFVKEHVVGPENQIAGLLYGDVPEERLDALEAGLRDLGFAGVERWPIGVSVITNTGPQALAVMYDGTPRDHLPAGKA